MIGIFLINGEGELAFAQFGEHRDIAGFRLHRETSMCVVELLSGHEEVFDDEMHAEVTRALIESAKAVVVHDDGNGVHLAEYVVPVSVVP